MNILNLLPGSKLKIDKDITLTTQSYFNKNIVLPKGLILSVVSVHFCHQYHEMRFLVIKNKIIKELYYDSIPESAYKTKYDGYIRFTLRGENLISFINNDYTLFTKEYNYFTKHQ
jgi:hypothetical protein